jgi:hypothetical protein
MEQLFVFLLVYMTYISFSCFLGCLELPVHAEDNSENSILALFPIIEGEHSDFHHYL